MKLLLAEDNPVARDALATLVTQWGYEVTAVGDGEAAWHALQQPNAPQLALLDWMMPVMDGLEVCQQVRRHLPQNPPYLILLTGRNSEEDLVAGLAGGANEYVTKPVSPAELQVRLQAGQRVVELQANLAQQVQQLEEALTRVKQLHGLLPICSYCKKIRDDHNYWRQVEDYFSANSEAQFSHSICPDCYHSIVQPELREYAASKAIELPPVSNPLPTPATEAVPDTQENHEPVAVSDPPPANRGEYRMGPRYHCNWPTPCRLKSELGTATVRDLSAGGIRLEVSRQIDPDTPLDVELYNRVGNYWHVKPLRIVHAAPAGEDRWIVGSAFVREFSPDQLRQVLK
jgi:CheY-like chemotaxis protein